VERLLRSTRVPIADRPSVDDARILVGSDARKVNGVQAA
jgi:hypothetical protein